MWFPENWAHNSSFNQEKKHHNRNTKNHGKTVAIEALKIVRHSSKPEVINIFGGVVCSALDKETQLIHWKVAPNSDYITEHKLLFR